MLTASWRSLTSLWVEVIQDFPVRYADARTFDDLGRFSTEQDRGGYRPRVPMPKIKKKRKLDPEVGPTGWSCTQVHLETTRGKQERKLAVLLLKITKDVAREPIIKLGTYDTQGDEWTFLLLFRSLAASNVKLLANPRYVEVVNISVPDRLVSTIEVGAAKIDSPKLRKITTSLYDWVADVVNSIDLSACGEMMLDAIFDYGRNSWAMIWALVVAEWGVYCHSNMNVSFIYGDYELELTRRQHFTNVNLMAISARCT